MKARKLDLNLVKPFLCNFSLFKPFPTPSKLRLSSSIVPSSDNSLGFLHENEGKTTTTTKPAYPAALHLKVCGLSLKKLTLPFTVRTSLFSSVDEIKVD